MTALGPHVALWAAQATLEHWDALAEFLRAEPGEPTRLALLRLRSRVRNLAQYAAALAESSDP